jgi:ectoine hydroxylase-related dioxygenase (phytanoyl-CoA dioxygenase family)
LTRCYFFLGIDRYAYLKLGDCIIHHPEVIHGSLKNTSNRDRIGLAISFMSKNAKIDNSKIKLYQKNLNKNLKKIYD